MFKLGTRVQTPHGVGTIVGNRMMSPSYNEVGSYIVSLDAKQAASNKPPFPSYTGTVFPANQVKEINT